LSKITIGPDHADSLAHARRSVGRDTHDQVEQPGVARTVTERQMLRIAAYKQHGSAGDAGAPGRACIAGLRSTPMAHIPAGNSGRSAPVPTPGSSTGWPAQAASVATV